jgi:SSS family solute:Na+ symporter
MAVIQTDTEHRRLGSFALAALLVSAHYGLGFILGTAEKALTWGWAGSLYPISLGIGTIVLLFLAKFYWQEIEPIWTLLGKRYGQLVEILVGFTCWLSLIGIFAVQIIAGAFLLKVVGFSVFPSMVGLTASVLLISWMPVNKASWLFRTLLGLNLLALLFALQKLDGVGDYLHAPFVLVSSLQEIGLPSFSGIFLSSVLLVLIDMKYQQFVVQAKTVRTLYIGCSLAAVWLLLLSLLPSGVVISAQNLGVLPNGLDGKETIPWILSWLGGGIDTVGGQLLILSLLVPALGVGSNVLRVQTKTVLDFQVISDSNASKLFISVANAGLGLIVALQGNSIVDLIVCFYAVYVATVWIPFLSYLLAKSGKYAFAVASVRLALVMGAIASVVTLIATQIDPHTAWYDNPQLTIMIFGLGFGILGLLLGEAIEKYIPGVQLEKES